MKETTDKKYKIYRVNPSCPNCGEEHVYYNIMLSEEEQKILDNYYADHQGESSLVLLLNAPPLRIERSFKCPICKMEFSKNMGIYRENAIDYKSDDYEERSMEEGMKIGMEKERLNAINRMLNAGFTKEQIISCGYTEDEFSKSEGILYTNA